MARLVRPRFLASAEGDRLYAAFVQLGHHRDRRAPPVVADRLGHSTIAITLDIYSVSPTLDADAANTMASQIFGAAGE